MFTERNLMPLFLKNCIFISRTSQTSTGKQDYTTELRRPRSSHTQIMGEDKDKLDKPDQATFKLDASETPVSPAITLTVSHHLNPGALRSAEVSKINSFVIFT